jgi:hypothetical protein
MGGLLIAPISPTLLLIPCSPPFGHPRPSENTFTSGILLMMHLAFSIKTQLNPSSANGVEIHCNWLPWGNHDTERVNDKIWLEGINNAAFRTTGNYNL